ncbi:MAG: hypothetical protein JO202_02270 [Ktedonobacteraceae bacterium]|nr:hypothetical protein [Ktedonobacteraceae bacterium]
MTMIWYEVFPVTLSSQQAILIQPPCPPIIPPWMIQHQPAIHPNDRVVELLMTFFGSVFQPEKAIVHSTSWRYECVYDQLLLTYVAVLPQGDWMKHWVATERIVIEPIGTREICYGDHLAPPERLERDHILAHALDHLASLSTYDPAIQAVLEPEWSAVLRPRTCRPAGCLTRELQSVVSPAT